MNQDLIASAMAAADQLPEPVKRSAVDALAKLVGSVFAIPHAAIRRVAQGMDDKTDARKEIWKKLSAAVGDSIAENEDLLDRATVTLMGEAYRRQNNREAVAQETLSQLALPSPEPDNKGVPPVDDDWMNVFVDYAEKASSERLRETWGRVLAGEIRRPGSFSLSTMRFVAELDSVTAADFQSIHDQIFADFVVKTAGHDDDISLALRLQEAGLISGVEGMLSKTVEMDAEGTGHLIGQRSLILLSGEPLRRVAIPVMVLTRVGREIATIVGSSSELAAARMLAEALDKVGINSIEFSTILARAGNSIRYSLPPLTLWSKPA